MNRFCYLGEVLGSAVSVDTEYFILFKADTQEEVTKNIRSLISNLAQSGLIGVQVSNEDLRMVLDNFLNGGKTFTERTVMRETNA